MDSANNTGNIVTNLSFANGPVTITATRTSATELDFSYQYHTTSGGTATVNRSDTGLAAGTYYFGMAGYDGGASGIVMDNLSSTATVPEPSAIVLVVTGLIGLLAYAWRKRR